MTKLLRASGLYLFLGATTLAQAQHPKNLENCLPNASSPIASDPSTWQSQSDVARAILSQQQQANLNLAPAQSQQQLFAASSSAQSYAPNFIGDLFGANGNSSGAVLVDRLYMVNGDLDADAGYSTAVIGQPFTAVGPGEGMFFVPSSNPGASVFYPGDGTFTTVANSEDVASLISASPLSEVPIAIINNAGYQEIALQNGTSMYGAGYVKFIEAPSATAPADTNDLANSYGSGAYPQSPNDLPLATGEDYTVLYAYDYYLNIVGLPDGPASAPGASVGRMKVAENTSPIPRDRVYVNYSYFNNTPLYQGGVNVNRVTPGFEKTFFNGRASVELRTPFATTLDSTVTQGGITNTNNTEFGNMSMFFKALLIQNQQLAFSTGLGVTVPTADDFKLQNSAGTNLLYVENQSVHLLPFVGAVYTPNDRFFAQSMFQVDVDVNGNPVSATSFVNGAPTGGLADIGRPQDRTYMYLSFNAGYWMFLDQNSDRFITGLAPMFEYHLNQTLDKGDAVYGNVGGTVWDFSAPGTLTVNNAVMGMTALIRNDATLTLGYCTPLQGSDRQFDGEFRLMFNWLFGNSKPTSRVMRAASTF